MIFLLVPVIDFPRVLSGAFPIIAKSAYQLRHVRPHVQRLRLPLDGFPRIFVLGSFTKIYRETPDLIKIGQRIPDTLH
jgi:hypothetical protein